MLVSRRVRRRNDGSPRVAGPNGGGLESFDARRKRPFLDDFVAVVDDDYDDDDNNNNSDRGNRLAVDGESVPNKRTFHSLKSSFHHFPFLRSLH